MINIRLAQDSDLKDYTDLLQRTYQVTYTDDSLGLTADCFSKAIFATKDSQDYLKSNLEITDHQKTWLALIEDQLVGSITIIDKGEECQLQGFYVNVKYKGTGIGKTLFNKATESTSPSIKDGVLLLTLPSRSSIAIFQSGPKDLK